MPCIWGAAPLRPPRWPGLFALTMAEQASCEGVAEACPCRGRRRHRRCWSIGWAASQAVVRGRPGQIDRSGAELGGHRHGGNFGWPSSSLLATSARVNHVQVFLSWRSLSVGAWPSKGVATALHGRVLCVGMCVCVRLCMLGPKPLGLECSHADRAAPRRIEWVGGRCNRLVSLARPTCSLHARLVGAWLRLAFRALLRNTCACGVCCS